ncbi:site-specific integrase [Nocardia farcinica]|uniref:site-specific integrase n=1 Tax=Nocardia farcinica TaxID=37329 RepID=UPI001E50FE9E|nr:site-specific integrase [Nocardia farcinica]
MTTTGVNAETLTAARLLLTQMGISPADLIDSGVTAPTFAEVIPKVRAGLSPGTLRTYDTYFKHLLAAWGDRSLDEPSKADLEEKARAIQADARTDRASRGGSSAAEHFISATRCVYRYAEDHGWIRPADNPARTLAMPARRPSNRYAIPSGQLGEICQVAATTGNDPELDSLTAPAHRDRLPSWRRTRTAPTRPRPRPMPGLPAREGRRRPLAARLPYRDGIPARPRRTTPRTTLGTAPALQQRQPHHRTTFRLHLAQGRRTLPWVATQGISMHWLRHTTTLTWVERTFSYAVAREYAGHTGKSGGTTATYVKSHLTEVAAALAVLTGEPHPLAPGYPATADMSAR